VTQSKVLPVPPGKAPRALEPELQLSLKGPDGLHRHARFDSVDKDGRQYKAVVPLRTAVGVKINSKVAHVHDQGGKQLEDKDEIPVQVSTPSGPGTVNVTLKRK
jgi:hypothetical protein